MTNKKSSSNSADNAEDQKMNAKRERERAKAAKQKAKDKARRERDAERYRKAAEAARKKAADERERQAALENDPVYQEKKRKEAERLKEKGRKEMEKQRRRSERRAKAAAKSKAKIEAKEGSGLSSVERQRRRQNYQNKERKAALAKQSVDTGKRSRRRSLICLAAMLIIAVAAAFMLYPPQDKITMGLDIQGGVSVNLKASTIDGSPITSEQMEQTQLVITNRVNASGAAAATVQQQGSDSFLVQVPGASDNAQTILDTLSSQGVLEFVNVNDIQDETVKTYIKQGLTGMNLKKEGVPYSAFMTGDNVQMVTVDRPQGSGEYAVNLQLDGEGTSKFADVSRELVSTHGQIAILLDGVVKSAPAVQSAITGGQVQITGNYNLEEANALKTIIESGSLPVEVNIEQASTVGPTLGQQALMAGIIAALIGLALVIVWMLLFYKGLGLLPAVSIFVMSIIYLGLLALLSQVGWFSLTLPGIAGIIVNIGMSADSSILIMECFHEQIREGKSVKTAAKAGVHEGIFTSLDADVVTLVSALILYFFAMGDVRGFGLTLALGIICDLVVMALLSGPIMRLLGPRTIAKHPGFWGTADDVNEGEYLSKEVM